MTRDVSSFFFLLFCIVMFQHINCNALKVTTAYKKPEIFRKLWSLHFYKALDYGISLFADFKIVDTWCHGACFDYSFI